MRSRRERDSKRLNNPQRILKTHCLLFRGDTRTRFRPRFDEITKIPGKAKRPLEHSSGLRQIVAPQVGLEPTTLRLTAECSAIELLRNNGENGLITNGFLTVNWARGKRNHPRDIGPIGHIGLIFCPFSPSRLSSQLAIYL